jgi:hypothetical protein
MDENDAATLEIRIPISPTRSFFQQVRFFDYALRRLGPRYQNALLRVVVGDHANLQEVQNANPWAKGRPIEFIAVPGTVFDRYGIHGTADFRLMLEPKADIVVLADADTIWLRDIDPLLANPRRSSDWIAGHMAHLPPPPDASGERHDPLWPWLLAQFGLAMPSVLHAYSMDLDKNLGRAPPYFNLGFIALSQSAARGLGDGIFRVQDRLLSIFASHMRCQIALTILALEGAFVIEPLPAAYNTANDPGHLTHNGLTLADVRVLHYLRTDILDRSLIVLPEHAAATASVSCEHPVNRTLQSQVLAFLRDACGVSL